MGLQPIAPATAINGLRRHGAADATTGPAAGDDAACAHATLRRQPGPCFPARSRRAAGFRCGVGIYHPRCFVVLITLDADHQAFGAALNRLRAYAGESIELLGPDRPPQRFAPRVGLGVVVVDAEDAVARVLLDQAEQEARASVPEALLDTQY